MYLDQEETVGAQKAIRAFYRRRRFYGQKPFLFPLFITLFMSVLFPVIGFYLVKTFYIPDDTYPLWFYWPLVATGLAMLAISIGIWKFGTRNLPDDVYADRQLKQIKDARLNGDERFHLLRLIMSAETNDAQFIASCLEEVRYMPRVQALTFVQDASTAYKRFS